MRGHPAEDGGADGVDGDAANGWMLGRQLPAQAGERSTGRHRGEDHLGLPRELASQLRTGPPAMYRDIGLVLILVRPSSVAVLGQDLSNLGDPPLQVAAI